MQNYYGTPGTVIVEFTIEKDNRAPKNIKIFKTDDPSLKSKALKIIKNSTWWPAIQNGKNVSYRMRQEIIFTPNSE